MEEPALKHVESGHIIPILKSPFVIGRGLTNDYVIANKVVSRAHCSFEKTAEGWVLRDLSTNGSMINKEVYKNVVSPVLKPNDEIVLGKHTHTYKFMLNYPKGVDPQVEKLKNEEISTVPNSRTRSPGTPNSFDENGISDDVLNRVIDDMLGPVEPGVNEAIVSAPSTNLPVNSTNGTTKDKKKKAVKPPTEDSLNTILDFVLDNQKRIEVTSSNSTAAKIEVTSSNSTAAKIEVTSSNSTAAKIEVTSSNSTAAKIEVTSSNSTTANLPSTSNGSSSYQTANLQLGQAHLQRELLKRKQNSTNIQPNNQSVTSTITVTNSLNNVKTSVNTVVGSTHSKSSSSNGNKRQKLDSSAMQVLPVVADQPSTTQSTSYPKKKIIKSVDGKLHSTRQKMKPAQSTAQDRVVPCEAGPSTSRATTTEVKESTKPKKPETKVKATSSKESDTEKNKTPDQNHFEEMEDELMCTICANLFIKAVTLGCSHSFCQYCIDMWKNKKSDCPICRKEITSTIRTLVLDNIIEKMLGKSPQEVRDKRKESMDERTKIEAEIEAANAFYTGCSSIPTPRYTVAFLDLLESESDSEDVEFLYDGLSEYDRRRGFYSSNRK